jgi:hypothetical protein
MRWSSGRSPRLVRTFKEKCFAAAVIASPVLVGAANAQSLTLSYALQSPTTETRHAAIAAERCLGFSASLIVSMCRTAGWRISRSSSTGQSTFERPGGENVEDASLSSAGFLPVLGSSEPDAGQSRELSEGARAADLSFRLGSRYRRQMDAERQLSKSTDVVSESRLQNNVKALGIELQIPFH